MLTKPATFQPLPLALAALSAMTMSALAWHDNPRSIIESMDDDANGVADHVRTIACEYSDTGLLTRKTVSIDRNADGASEVRHLHLYQYNDKGRLSRWQHGVDADADGTYEKWEGKDWWKDGNALSYRKWQGGPKDGSAPESAEGWDRYIFFDQEEGTRNVSRITWFDDDGDGNPELRLALRSHYDPNTGLLVQKDTGRDTDGSSPWEIFERRYFTYFDRGRSYEYNSEIIRDGVFDLGPFGGLERTYDDNGKLVDELIWKGIGDGINSLHHYWYDYQYDDQGRVILKTKSENLLGPPQAERWNSWERVYNDKGHLIQIHNTGWWNRVIDRTNEIQWENSQIFDECGCPVMVSRFQKNIVKKTGEGLIREFNYDKYQQMTKVRTTRSNRYDARATSVTVKTLDRDRRGRLLEVIETDDTDADDTDDRVFSRVYGYEPAEP